MNGRHYSIDLRAELLELASACEHTAAELRGLLEREDLSGDRQALRVAEAVAFLRRQPPLIPWPVPSGNMHVACTRVGGVVGSVLIERSNAQ